MKRAGNFISTGRRSANRAWDGLAFDTVLSVSAATLNATAKTECYRMLASAAIGVIAMGLGAAAAMALIQFITSRLPPKELAGDHGAMHPNDSMIAVAILIAAGVGCAGIFYHFMVANSLAAIAVSILSVVSIPLMATAFSSNYDISWDTMRITGPTTTWYSPFSSERRDILCDDLVAAGQDRWGNYYAESSDGTRIWWNWFYNGYPELMYFIEDRCPHLFPDDEGSGSLAGDGAPGRDIPPFFAGRLANGRLALAVQLPSFADIRALVGAAARACVTRARGVAAKKPAEIPEGDGSVSN